MNAGQWKTISDRRWIGDAYDDCVWSVIDAIAAAGIDTDEAVRRINGEAVREAAELRQTSGELCPRCGWRMVLPGDGCMKCECERLRGAANVDHRWGNIADVARATLDGSAPNMYRWHLAKWATEHNPPAAIAQAAASWRATRNETAIKCVAQWVLSLDAPASTAAPPDAERHAAITIAMNVSAGTEVERPAALRMVHWVLSQNPPWVVDEACRLVRDHWPAPESLRRVADWVLSRPADVPAPPDPERERRRWELYRDLVVREYTELADALRIADAALAAYYGEQHGS